MTTGAESTVDPRRFLPFRRELAYFVKEQGFGRRKSVLTGAAALLAALIILIFFNSLTQGKFLKPENINSIFMHALVPAFIAWGYCFIFALGYTDLSVYSIVILGAYAGGELGNRIGVPGVLIGGIITGIVLMSVNFNLFVWTKVPSWIGGLGMCMVYEAIAAFYSAQCVARGETVVLLDEQYRALMQPPWVYVIFLLGFVMTYLLYNRTPMGLNVRAIGSNSAVSKAMGIRIPQVLILTGAASGLLIGVAASLQISYSGRIFPQTGLSSLTSIFQPLATVLLAQVLEKRVNIVISIPFCAVFVYACFNLLTMLGVPSGTLQEAVLGCCVVIFGGIAQRGVRGVVK